MNCWGPQKRYSLTAGCHGRSFFPQVSQYCLSNMFNQITPNSSLAGQRLLTLSAWEKGTKSFTCPQGWHISAHPSCKRQIMIQIPHGVTFHKDYRYPIRNVHMIMEGFKEVGFGCVCSAGICERNQRVTEWGGTQQTEESGLLMNFSPLPSTYVLHRVKGQSPEINQLMAVPHLRMEKSQLLYVPLRWDWTWP